MAMTRRRIWKIIRNVWVTLGVASVLVMAFGMTTSGIPDGTFTSDAQVEIVRGTESIDFRPRPDNPGQTGLIFFPGGLVAADAYGPMARRLAGHGHPVSIIRLPFRTAPTPAYQEMAFDTARNTMAASPREWVIGGHSRGAMLATRFAHAQSAPMAGLALVGTTHPREIDLSRLPACVAVLKVSATRDGVARDAESARFRDKLPPHTRFVSIEGGNHTQFGYYRYQLLDRRASIDREAQQGQLVDALLTVLREERVAGNARCRAP